MGLLDKIFKRPFSKAMTSEYFKTLTAYTPVFTTHNGSIYEMELTRSAIHAIATQCSRLKPEIAGTAYKSLEKVLQFRPNPYMDTTKFIYRLVTILQACTYAFIVPLYDRDHETIIGFYPLLPNQTDIVEDDGVEWLRWMFPNGQKAALEYDRVGILTIHQFQNDILGDGHRALEPTMRLIDIQKQGIEEGIKQSAHIRFMARLASKMRSEDITKERKRFGDDNLSQSNTSGLMLFDASYADVKQIDSKPFIVDAEQMKTIQNNVFNYFGVNEKILQNSFDENEWNAFYEGKIEPIAIQMSLVLSNMLFTAKEISHGNHVLFSANRMQYASNNTKLQVSTQLFDRGVLSTNQVMEIWNMPHVEDGDKRYIRKEYIEVSKLGGEDA